MAQFILFAVAMIGLNYLFNFNGFREGVNKGISKTVAGKVKCSECLAFIPQKANKCSHCGSEQADVSHLEEMQYKFVPDWKRIKLILFIFALIFLIGGNFSLILEFLGNLIRL